MITSFGEHIVKTVCINIQLDRAEAQILKAIANKVDSNDEETKRFLWDLYRSLKKVPELGVEPKLTVCNHD